VAAALTLVRDPIREAVVATLSGVPVGGTYTLSRVGPSGTPAGVRGAVAAEWGADPTMVRDWEVPFGVPLTYTATWWDASGAEVAQVSEDYTHPWTDCRAYLVDLARPTNSLPLVVASFSPLDYEVPSGVIRVLDRRDPVVITLPAWTPDAELVVLCDTLAERDQVRALLGAGYPFLLRTDPAQGIGNLYLGVTDFKEGRPIALGTAPQRQFAIDVVQVRRPDPSVFSPVPPNTYQHVMDTFDTYADLRAGVVNYDALMYAFPAVGEVPTQAVRPWLPSDV